MRSVSIQALVEELEDDLEAITDATLTGVGEEPPAWMADPALVGEARAFTGDSIRTELHAFKAGGELPAECPAVDVGGARRGARAGSPLSFLLDGYRAGHRAQWDAWLELVERREPDAEQRLALLRAGSDFFFSYAARLSSLVTDIYMAERDQSMRRLEQRRVSLVTKLLEGAEIDSSDLSYPLGAVHIGISADGAGAGELLRSAIADLGADALLLNVDKQLWWAWTTAAGADLALEKALSSSVTGERVTIGLGSAIPGVGGFRATHQQAGRARALAAARRSQHHSVARYAEIALEDIASRDEPAALGFVAAELRGIDDDDRRQANLRETLLAYFAAGQNAKAAAAALGVHQQTVAQRLQAVEQLRGAAIDTRRAELETALRLRAALRTDVLDEPAK